MTDRQKQHLLGYLGYYSGPVDGIWGERSRQAARDFRKAKGLTDGEQLGEDAARTLLEAVCREEEAGDFWQEIENFRREEFRCTCAGRGCGGFPTEPAQQLVRNAQTVRSHFGRPASVSSGVRCALRNSELPGSAVNSLHLQGRAMDFAVRGISSGQLLAYVRTLPRVSEAYAIDDSYVHMGVEGGNQ